MNIKNLLEKWKEHVSAPEDRGAIGELKARVLELEERLEKLDPTPAPEPPTE